MKLKSIECEWSHHPPRFFQREVVVNLPFPIGTVDEDNCVEIEDFPLYSMKGIDNKEGKVLREIKDDVDGRELYSLIKDSYKFTDLEKVRFSGECLLPSSFRLIKGLYLALKEVKDSTTISIETSLLPERSHYFLGKLVESDEFSMIDNISFEMVIPPKTIPYDHVSIQKKNVVDALMPCIRFQYQERVSSLNVTFIFDDDSSFDIFKNLVTSIKDECMKDNTIPEAVGLGWNKFFISLTARKSNEKIDKMISSAVEYLFNNNFELNNILVLPPH